MNIQVESRELDRIEYAKQQYGQHEVFVESFETADYIFDEKVAFEYKTLEDFVKSVEDGRVFEQAVRLNEKFPYPFVIIEASDSELKSYFKKIQFLRKTKKKNKPSKFYENNFYGAIASLNRIVTVIKCPTRYRCFQTMLTQAKKCLDNAPVNRKIAKTGNPAYQCLRYCIAGVGPKTTEKIVNEYHLQTITDVMNLTADKLVKINGISRTKAEQIKEQIGEVL